jgi:hypothetical protein
MSLSVSRVAYALCRPLQASVNRLDVDKVAALLEAGAYPDPATQPPEEAAFLRAHSPLDSLLGVYAQHFGTLLNNPMHGAHPIVVKLGEMLQLVLSLPYVQLAPVRLLLPLHWFRFDADGSISRWRRAR